MELAAKRKTTPSGTEPDNSAELPLSLCADFPPCRRNPQRFTHILLIELGINAGLWMGWG